MIRAVVDINTFVSGIFWKGTPRAVYLAAGDRLFIPVMSEVLLKQLREVVSRGKFEDLRRILDKTPDELIEEIITVSEVAIPFPIPADVVRDPDDTAVLACAIGSNADYIVSGDKDLLVLGTYRSIPILTANQFLEVLAEREE